MTVKNLNFLEFEPRGGGKPKSLVMFLHGYGSNANDMAGLTRYFSDVLMDAQFMSLNAPDPFEMGMFGYQWFSLKNMDTEYIQREVSTNHGVLDAFIDRQLKRFELENRNLVLIGFSQGAMMSLYTSMRRKSPIMGVLSYSGVLAEDDESMGEQVTAKSPVLLVHGDSDEVVPPGNFDYAKKLLEKHGFDVDAHLIDGLNHGIDSAGVQFGREFLRRLAEKS